MFILLYIYIYIYKYTYIHTVHARNDLQDVVGVPAVTTPDHSGQKRTSQQDAAGSAKMAKN
jgi:hypothetical protein